MLTKKKNKKDITKISFIEQKKDIKSTQDYLNQMESMCLIDLKRGELRQLNHRKSTMYMLKLKNRCIDLIKGCIERKGSLRAVIDYLRNKHINSKSKWFFDKYYEYLQKDLFFKNYNRTEFFYNLEEIKQIAISLRNPDLKTALDCEKTKGMVAGFLDKEDVANNNNMINLNIVGRTVSSLDEDKNVSIEESRDNSNLENITNKRLENDTNN